MKEQRGVSSVSPFTIRDALFVRLVVESAKYYELRVEGWGGDDNAVCKQRGIMRGMAMALTKMFGNGYEPYWTEERAKCEVIAYRLAKEWVRDDKPEGDDWWLGQQHRFWKSRSDAASAVQRDLRGQGYRS